MKNFKIFLVALLYVNTMNAQNMNIDVNTKAKAYSADSIKIDASVDKVYSLLADIGNWPEWFHGVTEVHIDGNAEENKEFVWKAKGYKIKSKLHTVRHGSDIGWTGKTWWLKAIHNWHFESLPDGSTEVTIQESFSGFGSSMLKNSMKKDMKSDLICLKTESEK